MVMLHCLFAMVFAAATLGLLHFMGFLVRSDGKCSAEEGYSICDMWQDLRSVLSFLLGALLCCILMRDNKTQPLQTGSGVYDAETAGKVQLYACLL